MLTVLGVLAIPLFVVVVALVRAGGIDGTLNGDEPGVLTAGNVMFAVLLLVGVVTVGLVLMRRR